MIWGIDLGGTKIEGVVLEDSSSINVVARRRVPTEAAKGYEHMIAQVGKLIAELVEEVGEWPTAVGMGTPGTLDPTSGTMKNSNTTCLNGKPFKEDLEKALNISFTLANDANCFALAEALLGSVKSQSPEANVVFGVIMGTGVGGGLVVDGKVIGGAHGIGGEWGHNFLDESGGECYCGKVGCVETVIAGPSLERFYESVAGEALGLKEINERSQAGTDAYAVQTIDRLIEMFGLAISNIINMIDPEVIVLGGGVGNIDALYDRGVEAAKKHVFNPTLSTKFLKPELGDSAGVFGAAMLVK